MEIIEPTARYVIQDGLSDVPPRYKRTKVGVLPEDWESATVGKIASSKRNAIVGGPFGSDLVFKDYVERGVPVIRGQNMSGMWVSGSFVFVTPTKARSLEANLAHPGDIVFTQRGTLGQVSLVPNEPFASYLVSQSQMKVSVDREVADPLFFYYVFTSDEQQELIRGGTIQTGVPHINLGILRGLPVQLPPILEQRAIAEALSDVDRLLGALEALIAKKRAIKQAAMQQLLTGKTRLPGFSGAWERLTLHSIATILKGSGLSKSVLNQSGSRKCILYGELFTTYGARIRQVVSRTNSEDGRASRVGDVLMPGSTTTVGADLARASALLEDDVVVGGDVNIIRFNDAAVVCSTFIAEYLTSVRQRDIAERTQGITIIHLYGRDLLSLVVELPSRSEQEAIATVLSDMDADIATQERRCDKIRAIKRGMMQQLLTGRVRLVGRQGLEATRAGIESQ